MNSPPPRSAILSGVLGGLVVLVLGAVLIETDVIDTGDTKREVIRQPPITQPARSTGQSGGRTINELFREEGPGVVSVQARGVTDQSPFGAPDQQGTATGSGFVIDDEGYILTNAHVVEGSKDVSVRFGGEGQPIDVEVKGRDASSDIALLKIDPDKAKLDPIPLGDSSEPRVGDPVLAIGNPFSLELDRSVTSGIVSAIQRNIRAPNGFTITGAIQTDASLNPGNSGGPLIDARGHVIGINSQIATSGGGSVGIGFAVPINLVKKALPELKKSGKVERAYIGVTTGEVTDQLAKDLDLPVKRGALVVDVRRGSPAAEAGLRAGRTETSEGIKIGGDLIVKAAGKDVDAPDGLIAAIADKKPGDEIDIDYYRGRDKESATITLANRPGNVQSGQGGGGGGGGGGDNPPFQIP